MIRRLFLSLALGIALAVGVLPTCAIAEDVTVTDNSAADIVLPDEGNVYTVEDVGDTFEFSGRITGDGSLTKNGDGTLYLSNITNTYTGGTIVLGGVLKIADGTAINPDSLFNEVKGPGAKLESERFLHVGHGGTGALSVTDGGVASSTTGTYIGGIAGSSGSVTVSGVNVNGTDRSTLESGNVLYVGNNGTGVLSVMDGGLASSASGTIIGNTRDSSGSVTVSGVNGANRSTLETGGGLWVGSSGSGVLSVTDGGLASSGTNKDTIIGYEAGSSGSVTVRGAASELKSGLNVYVGGNSSAAGGKGLLAGTGTVTANSGNGAVIAYGTGTLSGGDYAGEIGTLNIAGSLSLQGNATLKVDLGASNKADLIDVSGGINFESNAPVIDLSSVREGQYILLQSGSGLFNTGSGYTLKLNGESLDGSRIAGGLTHETYNGGDTDAWGIKLTATGDALKNHVVTWTNGSNDGKWNLGSVNWELNGGASTKFLDGDYVLFNLDNGGTINISGTGKTVNGMRVSGDGDWVFNGNILADASKSNEIGHTGYSKSTLTVLLTDDHSVTLNGDNEFLGGIWFQSGTINLTREKSLGTYVTGTDDGRVQQGQVIAYANWNKTVKVEEDLTVSNRFLVDETAWLNSSPTLTFAIGAGKTLTIDGVRNTADAGDYMYGGAMQTIGNNAKVEFTGIGGGEAGSLVIQNSSAEMGGAIGIAGGFSGKLDFSRLTSLALTGNTGTGGSGGAISAGNFNVTLGDNLTLTNNTAGLGGGAIYIGTLSLGSGALFENNQAGNGGAIHSYMSFVSGNTLFTGNTARTDGGAIYTTIANLNTDAGDIAFTGNTAGGDANSIYLRTGNLYISGGHNVYFDDPVSAGDGGAQYLVKSGGGFVQFVGDNVISTDSGDGRASTVSGGTVRVVKDATLAFGEATDGGNTFNVSSNGTIAGGGTITAEDGITISGTVSPDNDRFETPEFDRSTLTFGKGRTAVADDKKYGTLTLDGDVKFNGATFVVDTDLSGVTDKHDAISVTGDATFVGKNTVSLVGFVMPTSAKSIELVEATTGMIGTVKDNFNDLNVSSLGLGVRDGLYLSIDSNKLLLNATTDANVDVVWTGGASSVWNTTDNNWKTDGGAAINFKDGDHVEFGAGANADVTLAADVSVSGMEVSGGKHVISGTGGITATDTIAETMQTVTGKLVVTGGEITFKNTGGNWFEQGIEIGDGVLGFNDASQLGDNDKGIAFTGDGVLRADATQSVTNNILVANGENATVNVDGAYNLTLSGVIKDADASPPGGLVKTGTGTLVLSGTNTYTGKTTVSEGLLVITKEVAAGGTSGVEVASGATLCLGYDADGTFGKSVSGGGVLTAYGGKTITLSVANNHSGATYIDSDTTLALKSNATLGSGEVIINNNGVLDLAYENGESSTLNNRISGSNGTLKKSGAGSVTLGGDSMHVNTVSLDNGTLAVADGKRLYANGTMTVAATGTLSLSGSGTAVEAGTLNLTANGNTLNISSYSGPGQVTIIKTTNGINGDFTNVAVGNTAIAPGPGANPLDTFFNGVMLTKSADGLDYVLTTKGLKWNNTLPNTAHGTFNITSDTPSFTLNAILADNTSVTNPSNQIDGWDGKTLTKTGEGKLVLGQTNTYTGATIIEEGTLAIKGANNLQGTSGVETEAGTWFELDYAADGGFAKVVSGAGGILKTGDKRVLLTGTNTFSGETIISGGTLAISKADNLGATGKVTVGDGSSFELEYDNDGTFEKTVTGAGGLVKTGDGTATLTVANDYTGATTVKEGRLKVTAGDAVSKTSGIAVATGGEFEIAYATNGKFDRVLSGSGTLVKSGTTVVTITKDNKKFIGKTIIDGGVLQLSENGTLGTSTIDLKLVSSVLEINNSADLTNIISGNGMVLKTGDGTASLSGDNTYTGGTTVGAGRLIAKNVAALGTGNVAVQNTSALEVRYSDTDVGDLKDLFQRTNLVIGSVFNLDSDNPDAKITETLEFGMAPAGSQVLLGVDKSKGNSTISLGENGGFNFGDASTTLQSGTTLSVADQRATVNVTTKSFTVNGTLDIAAGATLAVSGDLAFKSGSTLQISADASEQLGMLKQISGTLDIEAGYSLNLLVQANGQDIIGQTVFMNDVAFNASILDSLNNALYSFELSDDGKNVQIGRIRSMTGYSDGRFGQTGENFVAGAENFDRTLNDPDTPKTLADAMGSVFQAVDFIGDDGAALDYLRQLYGEYGVYALTAHRVNTDRFIHEVWRHYELLSASNALDAALGMGVASDGAFAQPAWGRTVGLRIWGGGFGGWSKLDSNRDIAGYKYESGGMILGVDKHIDDNFRIGFAGAYTRGRTKVKSSDAKFDSDIANFGVHLDYRHASNMYFRAGLGFGYGWNDYDVAMKQAAGGGKKKGDYDTQSYSAAFELGYDAELSNCFRITPSIGFEYTRLRNDGWNERATNGVEATVLANRFKSKTNNNVDIPLTVRVSRVWNLGDGRYVAPEARAAWIYGAGDRRASIGAGFAGASSTAKLRGVDAGRNRWQLGAGVKARLTERVDAHVNYVFETGRNYRDHTFSAGVGVSF